ncbi:unnamed protein product, partial [Amoebophrya sp. A120]
RDKRAVLARIRKEDGYLQQRNCARIERKLEQEKAAYVRKCERERKLFELVSTTSEAENKKKEYDERTEMDERALEWERELEEQTRREKKGKEKRPAMEIRHSKEQINTQLQDSADFESRPALNRSVVETKTTTKSSGSRKRRQNNDGDD